MSHMSHNVPYFCAKTSQPSDRQPFLKNTWDIPFAKSKHMHKL